MGRKNLDNEKHSNTCLNYLNSVSSQQPAGFTTCPSRVGRRGPLRMPSNGQGVSLLDICSGMDTTNSNSSIELHETLTETNRQTNLRKSRNGNPKSSSIGNSVNVFSNLVDMSDGDYISIGDSICDSTIRDGNGNGNEHGNSRPITKNTSAS
jgi:hypothetical protein